MEANPFPGNLPVDSMASDCFADQDLLALINHPLTHKCHSYCLHLQHGPNGFSTRFRGAANGAHDTQISVQPQEPHQFP